MNILKMLRKPYLAVLLSTLVLMTSCSVNSQLVDPKSFDYSVFEMYKSEGSLNTYDLGNRELVDYKNVLNEINVNFQTDLTINNLDLGYINSSFNRNEDNYLNDTDIELVSELISNIRISNFTTAIEIFESQVLNMSLSQEEFEKYNNFANVMMIQVEEDPNLFDISYSTRHESCGEAVAWYALATIALSACAGGPLLCVLAIANKIRAFRSMISVCSNQQ